MTVSPSLIFYEDSILTSKIDPEFFEARAILFSKMGQHRQALEIYVFKLEDYDKAEEYVVFCLHHMTAC